VKQQTQKQRNLEIFN